MDTNTLYNHVKASMHSPVHNYVIPGLTSWMLGNPKHTDKGCVRVFTMDREHEEPILPHSHRFDFQCIVLKGDVTNCIWERHPEGDLYQRSEVTYTGKFGKHSKIPKDIEKYSSFYTTYSEGNSYGMTGDQFHSIYFSKGALVLFIEGKNYLSTSEVLEPVSNGEVIPLFKTEPWMFKRG